MMDDEINRSRTRWRLADLPIELSVGPFDAHFQQNPIALGPCWLVLDRYGAIVGMFNRGSDASKVVEVLNKKVKRSTRR